MSTWVRSQMQSGLSLSREEFDNRVLMIFLILMTSLIVLGLFFIDFAKSRFGQSPPSTEDIPSSQITIKV